MGKGNRRIEGGDVRVKNGNRGIALHTEKQNIKLDKWNILNKSCDIVRKTTRKVLFHFIDL